MLMRWISRAPTGSTRRRMRIGAMLVVCIHVTACVAAAHLKGASAKWEDEIIAYENADRLNPPLGGLVVFVGDANFRRWESLQDDMAPLEILNRGFGGAQMNDINSFSQRIIYAYMPRAVVLYVGDASLVGEAAISPPVVLDQVLRFAGRMHRRLRRGKLYVLSVKPSIADWDQWPQMEELNRLLSEAALGRDFMTYVDVSTPMLDADGNARPELYVEGGLHMNRDGYAIWTAVLQPLLKNDLD